METVLLIEVPEAEPVVATHRAQFDPAANEGIPAHVTVLYPFVPGPPDDEALARVTAVLRRHRPFDHRFAATGRFDDGVTYLAPEDDGPFVDLIADVGEAFPEYPRYGGAYDVIVPHLTVARSPDPAVLDEIDADVARGLPVGGRADHVSLFCEVSDGVWSRTARFPLG